MGAWEGTRDKEDEYRGSTLASRKPLWTQEDEDRAQAEEGTPKERREAAEDAAHDRYFFGHKANQPHPKMAATGTEGRCELCGFRESYLHDIYKRRP